MKKGKKRNVSVLQKSFGYQLKTNVKHNWELYVMALPAMALLFCFAYLPMGGLVIAFKDFQFSKGIWGSDWTDPWYKNFEIIFKNNSGMTQALRNTICLNLLFIIVGTIFAVALAIAFNEITNKWFKKITQSLSFLPYFISTVVVGIFVSSLLNYDTGVINRIITQLGGDKIAFYMQPAWWPFILLVVNVWKGAGYNAVVYLSTISGIDSSYYEAAEIDGAGRWQQIWYITLPLLKPTIIVMTLMSVGRIMNADFGLFYNVTGDMPTLYPTTDVLDTYIYRSLRMLGDVGISSATGLFQSVVGFVLVMVMNRIAKKYDEDSALF